MGMAVFTPISKDPLSSFIENRGSFAKHRIMILLALTLRSDMYNKGPVEKVVRKSFLWNNSYRRDAA